MNLFKEEIFEYYKKIEPYEEPLDIYSKLPHICSVSEMSVYQQGFLCGLLKSKKPKKILEIGVSAGGTTSVILNCCKKMESDARIYSVDLEEYYYRNPSKKTGYVIEDAKRILGEVSFEHTLFTGNVVTEYLDIIGTDIDFLVLDAAHILPGEVLDFIVCLPFLSENAIVLVHDIVLNHYNLNPYSYATKVLFDSVVAEKYITEEPGCIGMGNIAAFQILPETKKYIRDVFSILTLTWFAMPSEKSLSQYQKIIKDNYDVQYNMLFEQILAEQKNTVCYANVYQHAGRALISRWENAKKYIFIYGCGYWGKQYYQYASKYNFPVEGMVVSDEMEILEEEVIFFDRPIYHLSKIPYKQEECTFIIAVGDEYRLAIIKNLCEKGYYNFL